MKNGISINGDHYELKAVGLNELVCDTCDLFDFCEQVATGDLGLCSMYDEQSEHNVVKYHFVKKHVKPEQTKKP